MKIYLCDPEKNEECSKTLCQKHCFKTFFKEYAKLDGNGEPIAVGDLTQKSKRMAESEDEE